jgi:hypothetical protein
MKTINRKNVSLWVTCLATIVLFAGCITTPESKEDDATAIGDISVTPIQSQAEQEAAETLYYAHSVRWSGETMSIIAGWYTGNIRNWKILAEVNPGIKPNRLSVGMTIRIPSHIMKTKTTMPKEHINRLYSNARKRSGKVSAAKTGTDEPTLFGPKKLSQ